MEFIDNVGITNLTALVIGICFLLKFKQAHDNSAEYTNKVTSGVIGAGMILFLAAGLGFKVDIKSDGISLNEMREVEKEKDEAQMWKNRYETDLVDLIGTNTDLREENDLLKETVQNLSQRVFDRLIVDGKVKSDNNPRPKIKKRSIDNLLRDGAIRKDIVDRYSKTKSIQNN
jgi:hypothetical protein